MLIFHRWLCMLNIACSLPFCVLADGSNISIGDISTITASEDSSPESDDIKDLRANGWSNIKAINEVPPEYRISPMYSTYAVVNNKVSKHESLYGMVGGIYSKSIVFSDEEKHTITRCYYGVREGIETIIMYTAKAVFMIRPAPSYYSGRGRYILMVAPTSNNSTINFLIK